MGFFSGYHGKYAMGGLGRIVNTKTGSLSKDARRVVSAFMRGEVAEGNCKKDAGCGIVSWGDRLEVQSPDSDRANVHVLAKREGGAAAESMEVCIPAEADIELDDKALLAGKKKPFERERSRDIRAASSALLQAVGAGVGVRADLQEGKHYFSGSKGKSRVAVPGACVRVKFDKKQRELAAMTLEAKEQYLKENAAPTESQYAKARAAVMAAKNEALAAKRKLALEQAAKDRPLNMAKKALEKAEASVKAAEARLFAAREKASAMELAKTMTANAPFTLMVNPVYGGGALPLAKKPRKPAERKAPEGRKLYTGAKGGQYYMRKGKRVYVK